MDINTSINKFWTKQIFSIVFLWCSYLFYRRTLLNRLFVGITESWHKYSISTFSTVQLYTSTDMYNHSTSSYVRVVNYRGPPVHSKVYSVQFGKLRYSYSEWIVVMEVLEELPCRGLRSGAGRGSARRPRGRCASWTSGSAPGTRRSARARSARCPRRSTARGSSRGNRRTSCATSSRSDRAAAPSSSFGAVGALWHSCWLQLQKRSPECSVSLLTARRAPCRIDSSVAAAVPSRRADGARCNWCARYVAARRPARHALPSSSSDATTR